MKKVMCFLKDNKRLPIRFFVIVAVIGLIGYYLYLINSVPYIPETEAEKAHYAMRKEKEESFNKKYCKDLRSSECAKFRMEIQRTGRSEEYGL